MAGSKIVWADTAKRGRQHVSAFCAYRHKRAHRTADFGAITCLACREPVVPRVGTEKEYHFAHEPESRCTVRSTGEGVRHYNAKYALAAALEQHVAAGVAPVRAERRCGRCGARSPDELLSANAVTAIGSMVVRVEARGAPFGLFVPDVSVWLEENRCVGVFEVVVTHRCENAKWDALTQLKCPVVEVSAAEVERWCAEDVGARSPLRTARGGGAEKGAREARRHPSQRRSVARFPPPVRHPFLRSR